jgi:S-DNA-T family DNA segregation ATPase FtsK/SpoIIIE
MAKQKSNSSNKNSKKNSVSKQKPVSRFSLLKDGRLKKIVGLIFLLFAIFLAVSFFSYFYTWQTDQDKVFNANRLFAFLTDDNVQVINNAGKLGAYISHQLIYKGLGLASFLLIPLFTVWGLNLLLPQRIFSTLRAILH